MMYNSVSDTGTRHLGAKTIKLGSWDKHRSDC